MTDAPAQKIWGEKIGLSARRLSDAQLVNRSGRHKARQIYGIDDAVAWVDRPKRATEAGIEKRAKSKGRP